MSFCVHACFNSSCVLRWPRAIRRRRRAIRRRRWAIRRRRAIRRRPISMAAVTLSWSGASAAIPARPCTLAGPCTRGRLKLLRRRSVFVSSLHGHTSPLKPGVFSHALDVPGWEENKGKDSLQSHQNCWRRQKRRHSCGQTAQNGEQKTYMTKSLRFVWEQMYNHTLIFSIWPIQPWFYLYTWLHADLFMIY